MSSQASLNRADLSKKNQSLWDLIQTNQSDHQISFLNEAFRLDDISSRFLIWTPNQNFKGTSVCVASSRLSRKLDQYEGWFDALRTLAVQICNDQKILISAGDTTTDRFVRRIAKLFDIPLVDFKQFPANPNSKWFTEQIAESESKDGEVNPHDMTLWYRPVESKTSLSKPNINDLLVSIAQTTVVLSVRKSGNILRAVLSRLGNLKSNPNRWHASTTQLLINRTLTPKAVEMNLLEQGATGWWLYRNNDHFKHPPTPPAKNQLIPPAVHCDTPTQAIVLQLDEIKTDEYLLHWTRRRVGPWPDQSTPEFLDDLIFQTTRCHHSQLAALCRILAGRRILASHELTRDRRAVVCFSDLPIEELPKRRVFRPHLSRWDFEPYGIAIDRTLMAELGARQVYYGEESDWETLAPDDQPYFQLKKTQSKKIDWQTEREWRILGDLALDRIPHDRAFVFVGASSDIELISGLTHWPIVVIPEHDSDEISD